MGIHLQDEAIEARIRAQCDTYGVPYHILHGTVASVPSGESSPPHFSSAQASLLLHCHRCSVFRLSDLLWAQLSAARREWLGPDPCDESLFAPTDTVHCKEDFDFDECMLQVPATPPVQQRITEMFSRVTTEIRRVVTPTEMTRFVE